MIKEKMIELLVLSEIIDGLPKEGILIRKGKQYSKEKLFNRFDKLLEEFLEPYVIESDSKE